MIASTCSRVRPVRRAIGFATDLATRPRTPVRDALPISTALSCAVMVERLPGTRAFETNEPRTSDVLPRVWSVPVRGKGEPRGIPGTAELRRSTSMAQITESIDVAVPVRTAYNQWTQFEEFPRFMDG